MPRVYVIVIIIIVVHAMRVIQSHNKTVESEIRKQRDSRNKRMKGTWVYYMSKQSELLSCNNTRSITHHLRFRGNVPFHAPLVNKCTVSPCWFRFLVVILIRTLVFKKTLISTLQQQQCNTTLVMYVLLSETTTRRRPPESRVVIGR
jgi:hypothetical protein